MNLLTRLRQKLFGLTERERRQQAAASFNLPFELYEYWPAGEVMMDGPKHAKSGCLRAWPHNARKGDIVTAFIDDNYRHQYLVLRVGELPGDDHIISPRIYDIEYVESLDH